jgi:hypothetical protein
MKTITFLGSEFAFIAILVFMLWCVDERRGLKIGLTVLLSAWLNSAVKDFFNQPRPYDLDPSVKRAFEPSPGFPSGHAQNSVSFWGILGSWLKQPAGIAVAILFPLIISFSRLYLGVHFPTDLLGGWILGGFILGIYFAFGSLLEAALIAANVRVRILVVAAVAFMMNALAPAHTNMGGAFFGAGAGYILMAERFPFSATLDASGGRPKALVLALRYALGLAGAAIIYLGFKAILPGPESSWYALGRFSRYALLGAWATAGAPWIFLRLKLAGARATAPK